MLAPQLSVLTCPDWQDYELLDSGGGQKLERYGPYTFVRSEHQAIWQPSLPRACWQAADAVFKPTKSESGGEWHFNREIEPTWIMEYKGLKFRAQTRDSRLMGLLPEQAPLWDWIGEQIQAAPQRGPDSAPRVLTLFAYTGIATLAAIRAGAHVTHVDASKRAVSEARQNQALSGLEARPVRWIVEDAQKFVEREARRGASYQGLILDPPKFGRGPKGEVWDFFKSLPTLMHSCRQLIGGQPLFVALTAYAVHLSALSLYHALEEMLSGLGGFIEAGELALVERSAGRRLFAAIFARWSANHQLSPSDK
jgi:23S rRNA (cytosine1962-C5)-methyltransferase